MKLRFDEVINFTDFYDFYGKSVSRGCIEGGRGGGGVPPPKRSKCRVFDGVFGKSKKRGFLPPIFNESTVKSA